MNKKTVVIGTSDNPQRYSNRATIALQKHNHTVIPVGIKTGKINDLEIVTEKKHIENVDTVTLYIAPQHQEEWKNYILSLKPKRVVFNPGTENAVLETFFQEHNIETIEACTLVMLSIGNY